MATTIGSIQLIATIDTSRYKKGAAEIDSANKDIGKSAEKAESTGTGSMNRLAKVGFAAVATAAVAAGAAIIANVGNAVRRVDTLNNSARVFENMGFAGDVVSKSMDALEKSIKGLPTPLDSAVRGMTTLSATYGSVSVGQQVFSALNDAILGFGGTAEEVDGAIQQLSQLPMDGPLDAQTWNSLRNSGLTPVLVAMAKDMGISINEMKERFGDGQLTVKNFTDALIDMDKNGGGGMKSLQKIVKDSTSGIGTSFANMNTAITRGIGNIIEAIGPERIASFIGGVGKVFEDVLNGLSGAFGFAIQAIQGLLQWLQPLFNWIGQNKQAVEVLKNTFVILGAILLGAVMAAIVIVTVAIAAIVGVTQYLVDSIESAIRTFIYFGGVISNVVTNAFNFISSVFSGMGRWFSDRFVEAANGVRNAFSGIPGFFRNVFNNAWNNIRNIFGGVGRFFSGLWNTIVSIFGKIGTSVGNAIGNAFKSVINGVLRGAVNIVNGFIDAINGAIGAINDANIPGVHIGKLGRLGVPRLAEGGIIQARPGGILANIAEGGEAEAVIPLSKLDDILGRERGQTNNTSSQITINISGTFATSRAERRRVAEQIQEALAEAQQQKGGRSWQSA